MTGQFECIAIARVRMPRRAALADVDGNAANAASTALEEDSPRDVSPADAAKFYAWFNKHYVRCAGFDGKCSCQGACSRRRPRPPACVLKVKQVMDDLKKHGESVLSFSPTDADMRYLMGTVGNQTIQVLGRSVTGWTSKQRSVLIGWKPRSALAVPNPPASLHQPTMLVLTTALLIASFSATVRNVVEPVIAGVESLMAKVVRPIVCIQTMWRGVSARRSFRPRIERHRERLARILACRRAWLVDCVVRRTERLERQILEHARRFSIVASIVIPFAIARAELLSWQQPGRVARRRSWAPSPPMAPVASATTHSRLSFGLLSNHTLTFSDPGSSVSHSGRELSTYSDPTTLSFIPPSDVQARINKGRSKNAELAHYRKQVRPATPRPRHATARALSLPPPSLGLTPTAFGLPRTQILHARRFDVLTKESTIRQIVLAARADDEFMSILPADAAGTFNILKFINDRLCPPSP